MIFLGSSFFIYSWSTIIILYDLRGLLLRLSVNEIIVYIAYQYTFTFFESVLVSIGIWAVSTLIARFRAPKNVFILGNLLIFYLFISFFIYQLKQVITTWFEILIPNQDLLFLQFIIYGLWLYLLITAPFLATISSKNKRIAIIVEDFIIRLPPLIGIYFLFTLCSIFIVFYRNFF